VLTRRDLLVVLGRSAAAGAVAALGCGGRVRAAAPFEVPDARAELRAAVARVRATFPSASGWMMLRERTAVVAGSDTRGTSRQVTALVVLRAVDRAGRVHERAGDDIAAIGAIGDELAALGPGGGKDLDPGSPIELAAKVARDPAKTAASHWLADLDSAVRRIEAVGSSRIVWRAAHAIVDDERRFFVGDGRDVAERAVRVKSGVTMVAWSGTRPMIGEVVVGRAAGLEALALREADVDVATARALELLTPGEPPVGSSRVLLDPSVAAALIGAGVGEVLTAAVATRPDLAAAARATSGASVAAPAIAIADDPTAGGYGGYATDGDGAKAARTALIEGGVVAGLLARPVRRDDGALVIRASDLYVAPGAIAADQLLAAADTALAIEDADGAVVDPATWRVVVRARRARKIVGGTLTGHAWTDVEIRGDLPALLGAVSAIGDTATPSVARGDGAASTTAPALVTVADVQPRRRV
jgi:predicted Zn-dependent protease